MITANGRFKTNTPLCLSMSDFHPETWNPMWCVGTILTGVLSFMLEATPTTGAVEEAVSDGEKKRLAAASMDKNWADAKFRNLFPDAKEQLAAALATKEGNGSAEGKPLERESVGGELGVGSRVQIDGIKSRPEINGKIGTVKAYLPERERYSVQLEGEELALKAAALTIV